MPAYQTLDVQYREAIAYVRLNRPEKRNAMNQMFWDELGPLFQALDENDAVRVVVLGAHGGHFSAGLDLALLGQLAARMGPDAGRNARLLRRQILRLQSVFNRVAQCTKPVLSATSGHCLGAGVDLIAACDLRYCSAEANFCIKEIDMGMAADVGTLQRLPRIVGEGRLREWAYTGCDINAQEALAAGLVNRVYDTEAALEEGVFAIARAIAAKSPLAVQGSKRMIDYMRDHRIDDGLDYVATWNAAMLQSADLKRAMAATLTRTCAEYDD
ncbi:crotonase/enoyl-CoA hydratase family protein [Pseudomonas typographi]|uniref:crotonase/enoyl-CoA hydratase family protein n=1 Tax=Pseudomonas typographi TaxID=2715964 RepID=UPI00168693EB|nr:crotonase/enoyl-CoA hydratase family protein [Pseudomonas typographi]MBD1554018.1 crotonase/enoyl-CoA hydratase family protein [Pseudomonas typographi]MBD1589237.1 crotonase/enoyl-CoA hydratase family protein [Pseudomonas typographi]